MDKWDSFPDSRNLVDDLKALEKAARATKDADAISAARLVKQKVGNLAAFVKGQKRDKIEPMKKLIFQYFNEAVEAIDAASADSSDGMELNSKISDDGDCAQAAEALGVKSEFDKLIKKLKDTNPVLSKHLSGYFEKNLSTKGDHPSLFFYFRREKDGSATLVLDAVGVHGSKNNNYFKVDKKGKWQDGRNKIKTQTKWSG